MQKNKKGKWICKLISLVPLQEGWECSSCQETFQCVDGSPLENGIFYCPNCGDKKNTEVYCK